MIVRRIAAPSGSLLLTLSTTPSMSANMRAATPRGCIWAWLARRRVTMASSAITRPYRSEAGSSWGSSAIDFTIGPRHPDGEWARLLLTRDTPGPSTPVGECRGPSDRAHERVPHARGSARALPLSGEVLQGSHAPPFGHAHRSGLELSHFRPEMGQLAPELACTLSRNASRELPCQPLKMGQFRRGRCPTAGAACDLGQGELERRA